MEFHLDSELKYYWVSHSREARLKSEGEIDLASPGRHRP